MKMEFPQYVRLQEKNDKIELDFYEALASERIKKLVLEKNYDFEKAKKQALLEFASAFNVDVDKMSWHVDLMPYIMCRHEISDSVFYSDFKEIRKAFGKKGSLESSIMVRAADAWLSTYELSFDDSAGKVVKSYSRDTVVGFGTLDFDFFERAYGITFNRETKGNLKIKNKWPHLCYGCGPGEGTSGTQFRRARLCADGLPDERHQRLRGGGEPCSLVEWRIPGQRAARSVQRPR